MRITQLDGLRGLFSVLIIFLHYPKEYLPSYIYENFIIRNSFIFVDFFFVISGFVISYNYSKTNLDLKLFLKKRIIRLYPLLFYTSFIFIFFEIIDESKRRQGHES